MSFQLTYVVVNKMVTEAIPSKNNKNALTLQGDFLKAFEIKIEEIENQKISLIKKNYVCNLGKRSDAAYIKIDAFCRQCVCDPKVKYTFTIKDKPISSSTYVNINYTLIGTHDHSQQIKQIRGNLRKEINNFLN